MKYLRYYSEFNDNTGILWRVEILQEAEQAFTPEEITLSADSPVTIEWHKIEKIDSIMSSAVTLTLNSDTDRQFLDLYQVALGQTRLDIYREGSLYWSGTLDTELYEEPYSFEKNYDVQITFSDFAILDRKEFDQNGKKSINELIQYCLNASEINFSEIVKYVSTTRRTDTVLPVDFLSFEKVWCTNFYDEDGEPMKLNEVLAGILKPFDLHIRQKAGKIYIWDWNALYNDVASEQVAWDGDDAVFGVDKTYSKVTLTFSPYQVREVLQPEVKGYLPDSRTETVLVETIPVNYQPLEGFKIDYGATGRGLTIANPNAKFFHIEAINSGSDAYGVAWRIVLGKYNGFGSKYWDYFLNNAAVNSDNVATADKELFSVTDRAFLAGRGNKGFYLKVTLDLMFDPRINPFEQADGHNEKNNYDAQQDKANFAYVPIMLIFRRLDGEVWSYSNWRAVAEPNRYDSGDWAQGEGSWGQAYLCYYDESQRKDKSGLVGWATNKKCLGAHLEDLPKTFTVNNEGDLILVPPGMTTVGGWLEFKIGTGIRIWENETNNPRQVVYDNVKWVLYKDPKIEIVDKYGKAEDAEDVEIKAWLNKDAKEELAIDTIVGTTLGEAPLVRGGLMGEGFGSPYRRGGHSGTIEQLLIGTIYSQYASRHIKISGTALIPAMFATYTDRATSEKFALMGETENLIDGSAQVELCELSPDEYDAIEYEENDD